MDKTEQNYGTSQKLIDMSAFGHMLGGIACPFLVINQTKQAYMYNFVLFFILHTIMEMFENSHLGVIFWKCNGHKYYYGDSAINVIGDTLGFVVGWFIGFYLTQY